MHAASFGSLFPSISTARILNVVSYKKKVGWHFVHFPCMYYCRDQNVRVRVSLGTLPHHIDSADAVTFSTGPFTHEEWKDLHSIRPRDQVWILATQEPASVMSDLLPPKEFRYDTYNLSFTFHTLTNIDGAYGKYEPFPAEQESSRNIFQEKTEMAAWVSTRHCGGMNWDRTRFVKDLGKHVPIHMYGGCGNRTLRRGIYWSKGTLQKYKFHVSLENSCCSEYITEKFWNALEHFESIPIVIGGTKEEYTTLGPPHSFIHAEDFGSMEELGKYIMTVAKNETLYNSFHDWRKKGKVSQQQFRQRFPVFKDGGCKVVRKILELEQSQKLFKFDAYDAHWWGSCYRCGSQSWIQDYIFWKTLTRNRQSWEDDRVLFWMEDEDVHKITSN